MRKDRRAGARLLFGVWALAGMLAGAAAIAVAQADHVFMDPALTVVADPADSLFTVAVARDAGSPTAGFDVEIAFDNSVVGLRFVTPGAWLTTQGSPFFFYDFTTPGTGVIRFSAAFLGQVESGAGGAIAVCHFRAKADGISPLDFVSVVARDALNGPVAYAPSTGDHIVVDLQRNEIFIDPSLTVISTPAESPFTVDVARNAGDPTAGFDVQISFDSSIVELLSIAPGDWLTGHGAPFFFYDFTTPGTSVIRFSTAFLGQVESGAGGAIAVCHFQAKAEGVSPLVFVSVVARDALNGPVDYEPSTGDRIVVESAVPAESATFGRLKLLYGR